MNYPERIDIILAFLFGPADPVVHQKQIVQWLRGQKKKITEAALSNFKKDFKEGKEMGIHRVKKYYSLLDFYITGCLGYELDPKINNYVLKQGEIPRATSFLPSSSIGQLLGQFDQVDFCSGRLLLAQKVKLIENARSEIIEIGIRLKTFTSYFNSQNDAAYKNFFVDALKRGVNIKCLVLNPKADIAQHYFQDRAPYDSSEKKSIEDIETVIIDLKALRIKLVKESYPGALDIFTYSHFPYNHFFSIDKDTPEGVIIISTYLYGIKRAKCPVFIVTKQNHPALFNIYKDALNLMLDNIEKIE